VISSSPRAEGLSAAAISRHLIVVEIQAGHRVARFGFRRLFLEPDGTPALVEPHDAVPLGIVNGIREHRGAARLGRGSLQPRGQVLAVEDVVAQDQAAGVGTDKRAANDERLGQSARLRLDGVLQGQSPSVSVTE
jgi:hypothetical protein